MSNISGKLLSIQIELKAPKSQFNKFGNYNYRNSEDILEAVKPLCEKAKTVLTLSDQIINVGERYYVEATATLECIEDNSTKIVKASAREADNQKGMNAAQITGSASSYARKYALNGLFNIDDTKDDDFTNKHGKDTKVTKKDNLDGARITAQQKDTIITLIQNSKLDLQDVLSFYNIKSVDELSMKQATSVISEGEK